MGRLTPRVFEYDLLSGFIKEALELHGQRCQIFRVKELVDDLGRDEYLSYLEPELCFILFADVLSDNKVNKSNYWRKETGEFIEAYIKLETPINNLNNAIVDITPLYWNGNSKFVVKDVYGQVNSIYCKLHLVPYRESIRSTPDNSLNDKQDEMETTVYTKVVRHKQYLNREKK